MSVKNVINNINDKAFKVQFISVDCVSHNNFFVYIHIYNNSATDA